jgi:MFS family permease
MIPRAWLVVILLWFVACSNYVARVMIGTMHGSITSAIPMTEAQFGLLSSSFLWIYGIVSPFAGYVADRFSKSRVILITMFVWSATTWLTGFATTFHQLIIMRVLMGLSEACYIPAGLALIADYHHGHTRALCRATALHQTGLVAGAVLAGVGGWLAEKHSWNYSFNIVGLLGMAYCVPLFFLLHDAPRPHVASPVAPEPMQPVRFGKALGSLSTSGPYLILLVCVALQSAGGWVLTGWLPTYMMEHFRMAQGAAGFSALGYLNGAGAVGLIVGGYWSDYWVRTNLRARAYVPALGFLIAVPAMLLVVNTDLFALAMTGLIIFGLTEAFYSVNLLPMLCLLAEARYRATGYGIINAVGCLTGGIVIYAAGVLRDHNYNLSDIFSAVVFSQILCVVLLFMIKLRDIRPPVRINDR